MNKLGLIIKREYLAKVRNKSFVIMTFLSPILMVGMVVLIAYLTQINDSESRVIAVLKRAIILQRILTYSGSLSYVHFKGPDPRRAKDSTSESRLLWTAVHIPMGTTYPGSVAHSSFFYTREPPSIRWWIDWKPYLKTASDSENCWTWGYLQSNTNPWMNRFQIMTATFAGNRI